MLKTTELIMLFAFVYFTGGNFFHFIGSYIALEVILHIIGFIAILRGRS